MPVRRKINTKNTERRRPADDDDEDDEEYFEADDDDADEEEDYPRNSKGKRQPRRRDDDDDEDDDDEDDFVIQGGWNAHKRNKAETSSFPNTLDLSADRVLVVFLDDSPLASYNQHWIERKGKRSFVCIGRDKCPLCAGGEKTRVKNIFNVVKLDEEGPVNLVLETGVKLTDALLEEVEKKNAPKLSEGYWSISRSGKGGTTNFNVARVKERDLEEDWGVEPLDDDQLEKLRKSAWKKDDVVTITSRKDLVQIAKESHGDYDDDF